MSSDEGYIEIKLKKKIKKRKKEKEKKIKPRSEKPFSRSEIETKNTLIKNHYKIKPSKPKKNANQKISEYLENFPSKKNLKKKEIEITHKKIKNINYKIYKDDKRKKILAQNNTGNSIMIEIWVNDRYGRKERIKCFPNDTILILKKLISAKIGTRYDKLKLQIASRILNEILHWMIMKFIMVWDWKCIIINL